MNELIYTGMKRRRKDLLYIFLVILITTFFMSAVLMSQNILNAYILEKNRDSYGDWIIASDSPDISHGYLIGKGSVSVSTVLCDEEGKINGSWLGSISDELLAFGRIGLYEGHFPVSDDEIAADLRTLQQFGLSYELGQQVTICWKISGYGQDPEIRSKTYTLCGTMKPFSQQWYSGGFLRYPDLVVTENELMQTGKNISTSWLYRMDPSLTGVDYGDFYKALSKMVSEENSQRETKTELCFNDYVYNYFIWGEDNWYLIVAMMILFSVFAGSFVLSSYTNGRRQAYFRLRTLGCSRGKLNGIIFRECGLAAFPPAVLGIGLAYLLGYIGCLVIADSVGLQGFFAFDLLVFLLQAAAVFGSILLSNLIVILRMRDSRLSAGARSLSPKEIGKLRAALPKLKAPEKELFIRQRLLRRKSRLAAGLFMMIAAAFLILCTMRIFWAVSNYQTQKASPDYVIEVYDPSPLVMSYPYEAEDGSKMPYNAGIGRDSYLEQRTVSNPYYGPDEAELDYLRSIAGVRLLQGVSLDDWHLSSWEGINECVLLSHSELLEGDGSYYRDVIDATNLPVTVVSDTSFLREYVSEAGVRLTDAQSEAFMEGDYALLFYPRKLYTSSVYTGLTEIEITEPPVREGTQIRIYSKNNDTGIQLSVLPIKDEMFHTGYHYTYGTKPVHLFISDQAAERLRQLEDPVPEYRVNRLNIWFNSFASFEATDKILTAYTAGLPQAAYNNYAEDKRAAIREGTVRPLMIFGSIFLMTLFVFMIIARNFTEVRALENIPAGRRIRQIGMTKRNFRLLLLRSEMREALPVLTGILFVLAYQFLSTMIEWMKPMPPGQSRQYMSTLLHVLTENPLLIAFENTLCKPVLIWMALMTLLLYLLMVFFGYRTSLNLLEREELI